MFLPSTMLHLPHHWGPSRVLCHGHRIWLPLKSLVWPAFQRFQLPLLSRSLKGKWYKAVASTSSWNRIALAIFPSWRSPLRTTIFSYAVAVSLLLKMISSSTPQQWNFFITLHVEPCHRPFENPGHDLFTGLLLSCCNSNRLIKQNFLYESHTDDSPTKLSSPLCVLSNLLFPHFLPFPCSHLPSLPSRSVFRLVAVFPWMGSLTGLLFAGFMLEPFLQMRVIMATCQSIGKVAIIMVGYIPWPAVP